MKNLRILNVSDNGLDNIDEFICDAIQLDDIIASYNNLTCLPSLRHIDSITTLNLSHNQLTSINKSIYRQSGITYLNLSSNLLTTLPTYLGNRLSNLVTLSLSNNRLTSIPSLVDCKKLVSLYINENRLTALPHGVEDLPELDSIDANDNQLRDLPNKIGNLKQLTSLKLSRNKLDYLPSSSRELDLLTYLELDSNSFTYIPAEIYEMKSLFTLFMNNNKIRRVASPVMAQSKLGRIYLKRNYITELSSELCNIVTLQEISMSHNLITSISPNIRNITKLNRLSLASNHLTVLPPEIGDAVSMGYLNLSNNQLTSLPSTIGQLVHLVSLKLTNNLLTNLPATITNMHWLSVLDIEGNPIISLPREVEQFVHDLQCQDYPDGVAFEIHTAFSKIDVDKYLAAIQALVPPSVKYTYMSNDVFNGFIMSILEAEADQDSQLDMIYENALRQINYVSSHKAMIFYTLEYMKRQGEEFRKSYVNNFIYDCMNAYNGPNSMSCPKGVMERLVTSLIPSLVARGGADKLLEILTNRGEKTISAMLADISKDCYERCAGDEVTFRALLEAGAEGASAADIDDFIRALGLF